VVLSAAIWAAWHGEIGGVRQQDADLRGRHLGEPLRRSI
jgi:hypothetical protein